MDQSQHNSLIQTARNILSEGFNITYNRMFEWDSDKAEKVREERKIKFSVVSSMFLSQDTYIERAWDEVRGEIRIRVFGLATNGKYYTCIYTKRKGKKRIISAWKAGKRIRKKYKSMLPVNNQKLVEHILFSEQKLLKERKMKDWIDYPIDKEYWEKELPEKKNIARVMGGTHDQYFKQMKEIGEKKLFKILRKKYGSKDIGDGQKLHDYYPITAEDIRQYG